MKQFGFALLVVVVCVPMLLVLMMLAAAQVPRLDRATQKAPLSFRQLIAAIAMTKVGYGKEADQKLDRIFRLDPENATAWTRRCSTLAYSDHAELGLAACRKAVELDRTEWNLNNMGVAQLAGKDYCGAEDTFTAAISAKNGEAVFLRNMGRAALACGHEGAGVAGMEVAEGLDAKSAAEPDDDGDSKDVLRQDREFLAVIYSRRHEPAKSAEVCAKAHPEWKTCRCVLQGAEVACSGEPSGVAKAPGAAAAQTSK